MADTAAGDDKKVHRPRQSGKKAEKKKSKKFTPDEKRNPKAFAIQSVNKAAKQVHRSLDLETKKHHVPLVDRTTVEPPPIVVCIVGPPKVGKTTLIQNLIKSYTREKISDLKGPVTIVSGKKRRLTLIECPNDINGMIDVAKIADLVLLLIDASFGFEMEIFEFLNVAQVHGFPKIIGVLTHLDLLKKNKSLNKIKKTLKQRFWTEVYEGAKLFYLSNITHGLYPKTEISNLGRFISVMKFRPLAWRSTHPYILADRFEDITNPDLIHQNNKCDRSVCLYGYMRGAHMKYNSKVHVIGCGDYSVKAIHSLPDPCPLPDKQKKRSLTEKEKLIFAPMSGVGGIIYDKDAVYIDLGGSKAGQLAADGENEDLNIHADQPNGKMMSSLHLTTDTLDYKMDASEMNIFKNSLPVTGDIVKSDSKWTMPEEEKVLDINRRERRKAVFLDNKSDIYDEEGEEETENIVPGGKVEENNPDEELTFNNEGKYEADIFEDDEIETDEEYEDFDQVNNATKTELDLDNWKQSFKSKFLGSDKLCKGSDIRRLVYGEGIMMQKEGEISSSEDEEDLVAGLFQKKKSGSKDKDIFHHQDSSKSGCLYSTEFDLDEMIESIKGCFTKNISGMNHGDNDDDDLYGDFVDLENDMDLDDDVHSDEGSIDSGVNSDKDDKIDVDDKHDQKESSTNKRASKKRKLKEMFDQDYDDGKGASTYYDDLKNVMNEQSELNKLEFENMEDDIRVQYEGFRAGLYVRIELENIPCEFITNFDASYPVIIGGLLTGEENIGFIQTRFKKHRWYERILKNRDPIILSVGWRRYQTIPLYSMQDHNGRFRSLKYTPEHLHCIATMYGPITPPSSGILAIQNNSKAKFKIAATGVVLDLDKSIEVVKKLKLVGTPLKVFKNTSFIKGMFNSTLEVAKFEGASIRTVSGIRGEIKKPIKAPPGAFRATFEDKILLSDIVFCRTWYPVTCPKFYYPVQSLLLPKGMKHNWQGMRTVGQLRQQLNIELHQKKDSLYKPIERETRKFNPLSIPKKLQKELPFKSKPKNLPKQKNRSYEQRRAVVMESDEKRAVRLMKGIFAANKEKMVKQKLKRQEQHTKFVKKMSDLEAKRDTRIKEQRKKVFRVLGQMEKHKQKQFSRK